MYWMMMWGGMLNWGFMLVMLPALIFSLIAQGMVKSTYRKQSQIPNSRGITGYQTAQRMLNRYNIHDVRIEMSNDGKLSDHYDPRTKTIRLSPSVYNNASVASVCIAAHEAGHAAQHANIYVPLKLRNVMFPLVRIGSGAAPFLVIIGLWTDYTSQFGDWIITLGLGLFALVSLFYLVTLPIEFNASRRALQFIQGDDLLHGTEYAGAKKVLTAAALTYVAALVTSLLNLLRFMALARGRGRR
ncbi:MAG: zinc metallopeptidase [Oscillospiraceae bacterium]|nr:zinc metallopeptidase [Oscillospiraceae bacterium]